MPWNCVPGTGADSEAAERRSVSFPRTRDDHPRYSIGLSLWSPLREGVLVDRSTDFGRVVGAETGTVEVRRFLVDSSTSTPAFHNVCIP